MICKKIHIFTFTRVRLFGCNILDDEKKFEGGKSEGSNSWFLTTCDHKISFTFATITATIMND